MDGGAIVNLGDATIHQVTTTGRGDHSRGGGEVFLGDAGFIHIGFIHGNQVEPITTEIKRSHVGNAVVGAELLVNGANDDTGVAVQLLLDLFVLQEGVCGVNADENVSSREAARGQHTGHCAAVAQDVARCFTPLGGYSVGVVTGAVIKLHVPHLALGLIVNIVLHGAGVVDHGLRAHPLLTPDDALLHVGHVVQNQPSGTLCRGAGGVKSLTESALLQVVCGERPGRGDAGGLVLVNFIAAALHGNVACTVRDESRHTAVTLAVLGQHLVAVENVVLAGREIPITEECLLRDDFVHDSDQGVGVEKIDSSRHIFSSLVRGRGSLEDDAAHAQIVLVGLADGIRVRSGHFVGVEAAGNIHGYILILGGANLDIITEDAVSGHFDKMIATMWVTVKWLELFSNIDKKYYLVQNYETDFYEKGSPYRAMANATYCKNQIQYVTISKWCKEWLKERFEKECAYAPNGLDTRVFTPCARDFSGKIRILIEGDCGAWHKNVDESFQIVEKLDREKFEIWYLSYNSEPKEWYKPDRFLHKVPFQKVSEVYKQCHILVKSSILESFSYPPLEMMATGGLAVVRPNSGNKEYLRDGENCLLYEPENISEAVEKIMELAENETLRKHLTEGGLKTARQREWETVKQQILNLYLEAGE